MSPESVLAVIHYSVRLQYTDWMDECVFVCVCGVLTKTLYPANVSTELILSVSSDFFLSGQTEICFPELSYSVSCVKITCVQNQLETQTQSKFTAYS